MFRTLGFATDALVMRGRSTYEDKGDHICQRTPAEPSFWHGNRLIYRAIPSDPQQMLDAFGQTFPDARHCVFGFDIPDFDPPDWLMQLPGFKSERSDVLATSQAITRPELRPGLTLKQIETDTDWAQIIELQTQTGFEQGYSGTGYEAFVQQRFTQFRRQCKKGLCAWFGVFDGPLLVADMGIVWDHRIARFQCVETRASHRGQGICAALLGAVHHWVRKRSPNCTTVIVADTDGAAGRIYRRAGFSHRETMLSVYKPGN